jgi:hypothetical protein
MISDQPWEQLLKLVEQGVSKAEERVQPRLHWMSSNRLVLLGRWQVEARFTTEPGLYKIYFERFAADQGEQNYDPPPGSSPKQTLWAMQLEVSNGEAFWRFKDGTTLTSPELARRVIRRLEEFHHEYGMAVIAP